MAQIPVSDVTFHPHSHGDPAGRLFRWNGELYRGIRAPAASFFLRLFETGVIQRLVDQGFLVETKLTSFSLDDFELVVHHRTVPFASYPEEWCAAMLRDAGFSILQLLEALRGNNLTLKDGHPWNVLFEGGRFIYVDLTSIIPSDGDSTWPANGSFRRFCLNPLVLMSRGHERIARRLLTEYEGIRESDLISFTQGSSQPRLGTSGAPSSKPTIPQRAQALYRRLFAARLHSTFTVQRGSPRRNAALNSVEALNSELANVMLPDDASMNSLISESAMTTSKPASPREDSVYRVLSKLRPASVLDMNSGDGRYARLAASLTSHVVAFDFNPSLVTRAYRQVRYSKERLLPLVMNFIDPTPARGLGCHWALAATERLQCDLVLALGVVDQAIFRWNLQFTHIVDGVALFAKRWLLLEFVPLGQTASAVPAADYEWYTIDNVISSLRRRFHTIDIVSSHLDPCFLLLCEK